MDFYYKSLRNKTLIGRTTENDHMMGGERNSKELTHS